MNDLQPCGHPVGCITQTPDSMTQYCRWCSDMAEIERLRAALQQAIELAEEEFVYVDAYFVKKWNLDGKLAGLKNG